MVYPGPLGRANQLAQILVQEHVMRAVHSMVQCECDAWWDWVFSGYTNERAWYVCPSPSHAASLPWASHRIDTRHSLWSSKVCWGKNVAVKSITPGYEVASKRLWLRQGTWAERNPQSSYWPGEGALLKWRHMHNYLNNQSTTTTRTGLMRTIYNVHHNLYQLNT